MYCHVARRKEVSTVTQLTLLPRASLPVTHKLPEQPLFLRFGELWYKRGVYWLLLLWLWNSFLESPLLTTVNPENDTRPRWASGSSRPMGSESLKIARIWAHTQNNSTGGTTTFRQLRTKSVPCSPCLQLSPFKCKDQYDNHQAKIHSVCLLRIWIKPGIVLHTYNPST